MNTMGRTLSQYLLIERGKLLLFFMVLTASVASGAVAAEEPLLALIIILVVPLAVGTLIWPEVSTLAVIMIIYTNAAVVAVRFHGVPYFLGAATPLLLAIPLANYLIFQRQRLVINQVFLLLVAFLVVQIAGTLFSTDISQAMKSLTNLVTDGLLLYFLIINVIRTPETVRRAIWALLFAGILMGGISAYQQFTGTFSNNYGGFAQVGDVGFRTGVETLQGEERQLRLAGPIGEKNYYAQIMLMLVPLGLLRYWGERSLSLRSLALIATALAALGVALTFSRGAAVGFVLVLVMMGFLRYLKARQIAIMLLGALLLLQIVPQFEQRLLSLQALSGLAETESEGVAGTDLSTQGRLGEMWAAGLVFVDHPIIGVGPGMFKFYYADYAESIGMRLHMGTRLAHNQFLDIAAETGALGLACFLTIVLVKLRDLERVRRRWEHERPELAMMATGFTLAIITYLATGLFLSMAYIRYFWLVMALAGATSRVIAESTVTDGTRV